MAASENNQWCSPDFTMTIGVGTDEDHALLMASIFRTCKHESQADFVAFAKEVRKTVKTRKDKDKELLSVKVEGEEAAEEEKVEETKEETKEEEKEAETKDKKDSDEEELKEIETIDDRVFVC